MEKIKVPQVLSKYPLVRNVSYNIISQLYFILLTFLVTPYIVNKMGADAYGILSIVGIVIGYFAFLDLGLTQGVIKYISEYCAKEKYEMIRKIVGTVLVAYLIMGFFGTIIVIMLTTTLVTHVLKIPFELINISKSVFYISALGFMIYMPLQVFGSTLQALQRFDLTNKIQVFLGSLGTLLTVLLLYLGYFLKEIVLLNIFISMINIYIHLKILEKLLPEISLIPKFDYDTFKKLFRFGIFSLLGRLMSTITVNVDKFLIAIFLPINNLAYYIIPYNISMKMYLIAPGITTAIFPALSSLNALNKHSDFRELYFRANKYLVTIVVLFVVLLVTLSKELLQFWMGADFAAQSTKPLQLLSIGMLINCFSWIPGTVYSAVNKPEFTTGFNAFQAIIGFFSCLVFIPRFGITGAALSWIIRDILLVPFFIHFVNTKICMIKDMEFIYRSILKPLVIGAITFFVSLLLKHSVVNLFSLLSISSFVAVLYYSFVYFFIFDKGEKEKIKNFIHLFSEKIRIKFGASAYSHNEINAHIIKHSLTKTRAPISISFYTIAHNRLEYTKRMIASLVENTSERYQHVIINSGSTDKTEAYLDSLKSLYPHIDWEIISLSENTSCVIGQNIALKKCKGDLLIKIDNDCCVLSKDIDKHLKIIYEYTGFDYALSPFPVGLINNIGGARRFGFEICYSKETDKYYTLGLTKHLGGLFRCIPKKLLQKVNGWEGYNLDTTGYLEDVFISKKIISAGYKMAYVENDCVIEHQESTLGQHERYGDTYFKGRF